MGGTTLVAYPEPLRDKDCRTHAPWHQKDVFGVLCFQLGMTYPGYSTTQVFYGQQLNFPMTRWQGTDGDHES